MPFSDERPGETGVSAHRSPLSVTPVDDRRAWDAEVLGLGGHPLQLWGWGAVKGAGAWRPLRLRVTDADGTPVGLAQVLVRRLPFPFRALSHVPRGPVLAPGVAPGPVLRAVTSWVRRNVGGTAISFEPHWPEGTVVDLPGSRRGANTILFPHTLIIDLERSEDELLADLSRTTRQGVRRSARTDLVYREITGLDELRACLAIYHETAQRAGFGLHPDAYYERVWTELGEHSPVFAAFEGERPVAFLWLAASGRTSFELYAGADDTGRRLRANYSLKWTAITAMKARGLTEYDVNGLLNDGISEFKRSFAGHEDDLVGTIDVPFSFWYGVWTNALPRAKALLQRLRRR